MTCIVGLEHEGKVYIGGDSAGVNGWTMMVRADEKVFTNGPFVMGFTSSFRMGQLLRFALHVPSRAEDQADDYEFMCTTFIEAVRKCLKDGGFAKVENGVDSAGVFLVGYRGRLYYVDVDFQVGRAASGYSACGCGDEIALGALAVTSGAFALDPEQRVRRALEAAQAHSAGVRGPFHIMESVA